MHAKFINFYFFSLNLLAALDNALILVSSGWPVIFKNKIPGFSRFFLLILDDFSRSFHAQIQSGIFKNTSDHLAYF